MDSLSGRRRVAGSSRYSGGEIRAPGCPRECLIDVNGVRYGVSEERDNEVEYAKLVRTFEKIEPYELG